MTTALKAEPHSATPDHNWTPEKLTEYIKDCFQCRNEINEQMVSIGRKSTGELFRAGHALHLLREKLKVDSAWEQWMKDNQIAKGSANEAIRLYYIATKLWKNAAETEVAKMTITEAKVTLGVVKAKAEPKAGLPKKSKNEGDPQEEGPPPKVDTVLVVIAQKLEEVSMWDRSDVDAALLDKFARQCIEHLSGFLLNKTVPMKSASQKRAASKKRKVTHAA